MPVEHLLHTCFDGTTRHKGKIIPSAVIGLNGIAVDKQEGDNCTPSGTYHPVTLYYRPDRLEKPTTGLPVIAITPETGWCDDPRHPMYNRPVTLPFDGGHEKLWLDDSMYDVIVTTSHNQDPVIPGKGSAIFIHLVGSNLYTAGCLAMNKESLLKVMKEACSKSTWYVEGQNLPVSAS